MMHCPLRLALNATNWHPSVADWKLAGKCIQTEERNRISGFHYKNDAKLSLAGRLLLRYAIACNSDIKWQCLKLIRSDKAKPLLHSQHDCDIKFNASHQGDYVVVVTDNVDVGIDIMDLRERHGNTDQFFNLMYRQFTDDEWKTIKSSNDHDQQMQSFYRHWCLKESFVKAIGAGIGYSLLSLNFVTKSSLLKTDVVLDTQLYINNHLTNNWSFEESFIDDNHTVAVARNSHSMLYNCNFRILTFDEVMSQAQPLNNDSWEDELFLKCYNNPFKVRKNMFS